MPIDTKLLERLRKNDLTLTKLVLNDQELTDSDIKELCDVLNNNTAVKILELKNNKISTAGAKIIAEVLEQNQTLTSINLDYNQIGDAGALFIIEALKQNRILTCISLSDNKIGDVGAQALAKALEQNQKLRSIYLLANQIGDAGAQAIAKALEQNQNLSSIGLHINKIGDVGAQALANALENNCTLKHISLSRNSFGASGNQALVKALEQNQTLRSIDLGKIDIGVALAWVKVLEKNRTLSTINLGRIDNTVAQALIKILEKNRSLTYIYLIEKDIDKSLKIKIDALIEKNCEYAKQCKMAAEKNDIFTVRELIKTNVDIDYEANRRTALHIAAANGNTEILMLLLMAGADKHLLYDGKDFLQIAEEKNQQIIVDLFQAKAQLPKPLLLQCDKIFMAYRQAEYQSALTLCRKMLLVAAKNVWVIAMQKEIEQSLAYEKMLTSQAEEATHIQAIKDQAAMLYQEAWQGYETDDLVKALTKFTELQTLAPDLYPDVSELIHSLSAVVKMPVPLVETPGTAEPLVSSIISSEILAQSFPPQTPTENISPNQLADIQTLKMHASSFYSEAKTYLEEGKNLEAKIAYRKAQDIYKELRSLGVDCQKRLDKIKIKLAELKQPQAASSSSEISVAPPLLKKASVTELSDLSITLPADTSKRFNPPTGNVKGGFFKQPVAAATSASQASSSQVSSVNGLGSLLQALPGERGSINTTQSQLSK